MPASIRPLSPPHKGLRNALGLLSCYSGTCDYADLASVQRFRQCASDFHALCIDHEANEERYVFEPLAQRTSMDLKPWRNEHKELHNSLSELLRPILDSTIQSSDELYQQHLNLSVFHARYLKLMHWEDTVIEPLMQELFSDAELQGHQIAIMQKTTSDLLLLWFKYIVPARQLSENLQVLTAYRASVPQEQFDIVMKQIERAMDPNSFHVLNRALNG